MQLPKEHFISAHQGKQQAPSFWSLALLSAAPSKGATFSFCWRGRIKTVLYFAFGPLIDADIPRRQSGGALDILAERSYRIGTGNDADEFAILTTGKTPDLLILHRGEISQYVNWQPEFLLLPWPRC